MLTMAGNPARKQKPWVNYVEEALRPAVRVSAVGLVLRVPRQTQALLRVL